MCFFQVRLNSAESSDVLKRWAEHLCSPQVNQKSKAILVLLSLGCFYKVGEMLHRYSKKTIHSSGILLKAFLTVTLKCHFPNYLHIDYFYNSKYYNKYSLTQLFMMYLNKRCFKYYFNSRQTFHV